MSLFIRLLEVLNNFRGMVFCWSPPLWAIGLEHVLQTIVDRGGLKQREKSAAWPIKTWAIQNFIGPNQ